MHHIGRELRNIVPTGAKTVQNVSEVLEHAMELGSEIVLTDDRTIRRDSELAGDEEQIAGTDPRCV